MLPRIQKEGHARSLNEWEFLESQARKNTPEAWQLVDQFLLYQNHASKSFSHPTAGDGLNVLHLAAAFNREDASKELLQREEVNRLDGVGSMILGSQGLARAETSRGLTPLHMAAQAGHHKILQVFLVHENGRSGLTNYVNCRDHGSPEHDSNIGSKNSASWRRSFVQSHASVPERNGHRTALHYAAENGHVESVKFLLASSGVELGLQDLRGETPLHLAIRKNCNNGDDVPNWWAQHRNHLSVVKVITKQLLRKGFNLNLQNVDGDTLMHVAVQSKDVEVVRFLCQNPRIIATKKNMDWKTPMHLLWELHGVAGVPADDIEMMKGCILQKRDVKLYVDELKEERVKIHTFISIVLVGPVLMAGFSFSGIIQMPKLPDDSEFASNNQAVTNFTSSASNSTISAWNSTSGRVNSTGSPSNSTSSSWNSTSGRVNSTGSPSNSTSSSWSSTSSAWNSTSSSNSTSALENLEDRKAFYIAAINTFRGSNNMCFFLSIVTMIVVIQAPVKYQGTKFPVFIEVEVEHLRNRRNFISLSLVITTALASAAFISGGLANIPVHESQWSNVLLHWVRKESILGLKSTMLSTDILGAIILLVILIYVVVENIVMLRRSRNRISFDSLLLVSQILILIGMAVYLIMGLGILKTPSSGSQKVTQT